MEGRTNSLTLDTECAADWWNKRWWRNAFVHGCEKYGPSPSFIWSSVQHRNGGEQIGSHSHAGGVDILEYADLQTITTDGIGIRCPMSLYDTSQIRSHPNPTKSIYPQTRSNLSHTSILNSSN